LSGLACLLIRVPHRKIKRIVFETLHKFDGQKEVPLSLSQIKQIAGRAGRFGLHSESSVGEVTTLDPSDLPILEKAMKSVNPPVSKARVIPASYVVEKIYETLPRNPKLSTIYDIISRLSVFRTSYDLADLQRRANLADFLEEKVLDLNLHDKIILCDAPTPWNDPTTREVMGRFAQAFATRLSVDLLDGLKGHPGLVAFENVKVLQQTQGSTTTKKAETEEKKAAPMTPYTLMQLESLHRSIVLYLWLTYRLPLAFSQQEFAVKMKDEVEKAIQFSLEALRSSKERRSGRAVGKNGESARRSERDYGALTWTTSRRMDLFGKTVKLQPSS
jgi:ATP-dependent RNA helicase SUPV3L1/SUV3